MDVYMKILILSADAPPHHGGMSRLVGLLKEGLERSGHLVDVTSPTFKARELKFSAIPFRSYSSKYDLVHLHGPTPFLSDLTLITNAKSRIVYTHHAEVSWISESLSSAYRSLHRFLAKRARRVIVHSRDYLRLFNGQNVTMVRLPSPMRLPSKKIRIDEKLKDFTVLYVGQFRPFKGTEVLIKAAATLKEVNFVLAGEGYLKPKLMSMAKGLRNLSFARAANDDELQKLYRQSHIICLPSVNTTEAYGLVLLEGAVCGCVPLASNLIGVSENVSLLKGLSFEKKSVASLTSCIRMLADDRARWRDLALRSQKAAYDYATMYTPTAYVRRHEEIFREVCKN